MTTVAKTVDNIIKDRHLNQMAAESETPNAKTEEEIECLRAHLTAQLREIEILESMYSMPGEFYLHSPTARADLENFCMDKSLIVPTEISYDIKLQCEQNIPQVPATELVATVTYPLDYPLAPPNVHVRLLNHYATRQHQHYLNRALTSWIKSFSKGDPCILQVFTWIEQNTTSYVSSIRPLQLSSSESEGDQQPAEVEFERLWIYSHHIYGKEKREIVMAKARNLELTGWMLIGKPGLICVEGMRQDTRAFWEQIRRLSWQRITLKHQENSTIPADNVAKEQKFSKFKEITTTSANNSNSAGGTQSGNRDMGEFFRFLKEHDCEHIIQLVFGIKNQNSNTNEETS
ncbi:RWD domain-containing protein 2B-like [Paramacrobiotus metropolitanus]|uniref:RWD domain-containing protein 2B-like n=1 Tax=Paramacrobiotus metropolitanus TaxID=2943436 RepID=UPI002445749B|nr:RWD domain-containing protein 2B-like [Paramacrobiotus metropolitanus]